MKIKEIAGKKAEVEKHISNLLIDFEKDVDCPIDSIEIQYLRDASGEERLVDVSLKLGDLRSNFPD